MQQEELQRIAQLVEMNRQKMTRIEEQLSKLAEVRLEQLGVITALQAMETGRPTMVPLGSGVQMPATPTSDSIIIDIGSGVQAEKPRAEAIMILEARGVEIGDVMAALQTELDETEKVVAELASTFTTAAEALKAEESEEPTPVVEKKPARKRRKRGTELTLDD